MDNVQAFLNAGLPREAAFSEAEYSDRLSRVRGAMAQAALDLLLVHNTPNICYISGHQSPMADWYHCLVVPLEGDPVLQIPDVGLAIVHSYLRKFAWVRWDTMTEAADQLVDILRAYALEGKRVGIETCRPGLNLHTYQTLRTAFPRTEFVDTTDLVLKIRAVKSPAEVECLRQAARFTAIGMHAAIGTIKPGATENSIAAAACDAMISAGSEFFSIEPHIRAGARSSMPHATFKRGLVKPGDSIVLEFGGVYQRYTAPLFRTAVIGRPPERMRRLAEISLATLEVLYETIRPGRSMDEVARATAKKLEGLDPDVGFNQNHAYAVGIGFPPDWVEHSVFIRPGAKDVLEPGMTFHTPRSFRIPGLMYVGFSETILVTQTGCEPLTHYPRELIVV